MYNMGINRTIEPRLNNSFLYNGGEVIVSRDVHKTNMDFISDDGENVTVIPENAVIVFCRSGKIQTRIGNKSSIIRANEFTVIPPHLVLTNMVLSPDFTCDIISLKIGIIRDFFVKLTNAEKLIQALYEDPVFNLNEVERRYVYSLYDMVYDSIISGRYEKHPLVMKALIDALVSVVSEVIYSQRGKSMDNLGFHNFHGNEIVREFLIMQSNNKGCERSVNVYADRLNITAKYLATLVKRNTGKTPIKIITETAIQGISNSLRFSSKSIKEIAVEFEFDNFSFFCKYVKKHLGMSPMQYRIQELEGKIDRRKHKKKLQAKAISWCELK